MDGFFITQFVVQPRELISNTIRGVSRPGHKINSLKNTHRNQKLTLKVLVATIDTQWEGMGDVGSARYEPALLPPCPTSTLRVNYQ